MKKNKNSIAAKILDFLAEQAEYLPMPFETPYRWIKRTSGIPYKGFYNSIDRLKKSGSVEVISKAGKKFVKLTHKGALKNLLEKAKLPYKPKWDGKWRMVLFDIPEDLRRQRGILRRLLYWNNYLMLQKSVFISPYELKEEAIEYLNRSGLKEYIRILRIDKMDDDSRLRKHFRLP